MLTDRQTDVGHINLIGGLVTRNPPKNHKNIGYLQPIRFLTFFKEKEQEENFLKTHERNFQNYLLIIRINIQYHPKEDHVCLSECITQILNIRSGLYFFTRWSLNTWSTPPHTTSSA